MLSLYRSEDFDHAAASTDNALAEFHFIREEDLTACHALQTYLTISRSERSFENPSRSPLVEFAQCALCFGSEAPMTVTAGSRKSATAVPPA